MCCVLYRTQSHTDQTGNYLCFLLHALSVIKANGWIVKNENIFNDCLVVSYCLHQISLKLTH